MRRRASLDNSRIVNYKRVTCPFGRPGWASRRDMCSSVRSRGHFANLHAPMSQLGSLAPHQRTPLPAASVGQDGHRRYYEIGGVTVEVHSDPELPLSDGTFTGKFRRFEVQGPGRDTISIRHHLGLPEPGTWRLGREVYRRTPWVIFAQEDSWIYFLMAPSPDGPRPYCAATFDADYSRGEIYHASAATFLRGDMHSLTTFPTDQILLAQVFARRNGCVMHSAAAIMQGQGLLFVGHSEAGKSTTMEILRGRAEILCDDRNVLRRWPDGFRVHGTWSHGDVAQVSGAGAPLRAVLFLCQSRENRLVPMEDRKTGVGRLLGCLIRPLASAGWWERSIAMIAALVREVPCYEMQFDRSGRIVGELEALVRSPSGVVSEEAA